MQRDSSYTTGPLAVLRKAPTRQTEAQVGSSQCMQSLRTNRPPRDWTTVKARSERSASVRSVSGAGSALRSAQASAQAPQPMQSVVSIRSPLGEVASLA